MLMFENISGYSQTWVHYYTSDKKVSVAWKDLHSPAPKVYQKIMATVFGDMHLLLMEYLSQKATISRDVYCQTFEKLQQVIQQKRRGRLIKGIWLLHNHTRP